MASLRSEVLAAASDPDQLWVNQAELSPAPIPADWIIEGKPVARNRSVYTSSDGMAATLLWDCTAGRFNWFYGLDETIYLLAGSITVIDSKGTRHHLRAGDIFFFPAGSRFEWLVDSYVRKIAFLHVPLSAKIQFLQRIKSRLGGLLKPGGRKAPASPTL